MKGSSQQQPEAASVAPVWKVDDLVWCYRCKRIESVGAVLHDGPYTLENSRLVTLAANRDPGMESVRGAVGCPGFVWPERARDQRNLAPIPLNTDGLAGVDG